MKRQLFSRLLISVLVLALSSSMVLAQEKFPGQPIRLIVAQGAGGTTDFVARIVQAPLQKSLGVSLVIENMVGGGGNTASAFVYKQKADGYTLLMRKQPSMSGGEVAQKGKFETLKFVHVYNITGKNYTCVAVPFQSPLRTVEDLKKASSSQPLITAGPGLGTIPYIAAMLMKKYAGMDISYVPFNSGSESALAVAGGKTQIGMGNFDSYHPLLEQKKVRVIALVAPERDPAYPDIPTVAEQGYPQVVLDEMTGVFAPPGLPKERLDILVKGFEKAVADPDLKAAASKAQVSLLPLASEEFFKASKRMHESVKEMEDLLKAGEPK